MICHHGWDRLSSFRNAVVTVGSFDGLHLGHQKLIGQLVSRAEEISGESVLVTFDPHPRQVIVSDRPPIQLLSTTSEKLEVLEQLGIDHVVIVPFNQAFAQMSPEAYIKEFLVEKLQVKVLFVGFDHKFGHRRAGDLELLESMAGDQGYELEIISKKALDDIKVSSTAVRKKLLSGDVQGALHLLGRAYSLSGIIQKGDQYGRTIGYPTANLSADQITKLIPAHGVYATRVRLDREIYPAMSYIGDRPVIDGDDTTRIETYILDFDADIYGHEMTLYFDQHVRGDMNLSDLEALRLQLERDEEAVRKILGTAQ